MKRRFFECAILLGIVMSVMFLAQTQDVIGHGASEGHKKAPHRHDSATNVDSNGKPLPTGGQDPRGNHYSGNDPIGEEAKAWGFRYGPGKYSTSATGNPDNDTQNVWALRVDVKASTGTRHARLTVTPSISGLMHYPKKKGTWQGSAKGSVSFSGVCFHTMSRQFFVKCREHKREEDSWTDSGFLDLEVKNSKISEGDKKTYGSGFESKGAKLTVNSEHSYTTSYDDLHARGYRFIIELKVPFWVPIARFQDKDASGWGQLSNKDVVSNTAIAAYRFTRWKKCYCGLSKTYTHKKGS